MRGLILILSTIGLFIASGTAQSRPAPEIGPPELYFLAVGSGEYSGAETDLVSAEVAASIVADALHEAGAVHGILLTSNLANGEPGRLIGRGDVRRALVDLKARIRSDGASRPRIVVYMMGHGYGDADTQIFYFVPGTLTTEQREIVRSGTARFIAGGIWNLDIIGALNFFRTHFSMQHFDDFLPSDVLIDPADPIGSMMRVAQSRQRLLEADLRNQEAGNYLPDGNPPVPFVALFDNCSTNLRNDFGLDASFMNSVMSEPLRGLTEEGLALYAAEPGRSAGEIALPPEVASRARALGYERSIGGPLAVRLVEVLTGRDPETPMSITALEAAMLTPAEAFNTEDSRPFTHGGRIVSDTREAQIIPERPSRPTGTIERRYGTGT